MEALTSDSVADLIDFIRPILTLDSLDPTFLSTNGIRVTFEQLRKSTAALLKELTNADGRLPKPLRLGEFRNKAEDIVFKSCSKLLHPTSVSILMLPDETEAQLEARRVYLRSVALYYANTGLDALLARSR